MLIAVRFVLTAPIRSTKCVSDSCLAVHFRATEPLAQAGCVGIDTPLVLPSASGLYQYGWVSLVGGPYCEICCIVAVLRDDCVPAKLMVVDTVVLICCTGVQSVSADNPCPEAIRVSYVARRAASHKYISRSSLHQTSNTHSC